MTDEPRLEPHPESDESPKSDHSSKTSIPSGLIFVLVIGALVVLIVVAHVMGIIGPGLHGGAH